MAKKNVTMAPAGTPLLSVMVVAEVGGVETIRHLRANMSRLDKELIAGALAELSKSILQDLTEN